MDFEKIIAATKMLIGALGDDINREGLVDTPTRVANIWKTLLSTEQPSDELLLKKTFSVENYNDFILVKNIEFSSFCEHHLLPFFGTVAIAYIPSDKNVVGLSKIARIVDKYSKKLQLQERLTQQILEAIGGNIANDGVFAVVQAKHMCMTTRGVLQPRSETITRAMTGKFLSEKSLVLDAQQLIFAANNK